MDELTFNFNSLWKTFSSTGSENLIVSVYQGNGSIVVFKRNKGEEKTGPVVKFTLSRPACIKIIEICKSLLNGQPETRLPFIQLDFSKEQRAYETKTTFVFYKDEKRCYGVEITNKYLPTPLKFPFKCSSTFSTSNEPMTDEQKSELALKEFMELLSTILPMATTLSRFNMKPNNRRQISRQPAGAHQYSNNQSRDPYKGSAQDDAELFG